MEKCFIGPRCLSLWRELIIILSYQTLSSAPLSLILAADTSISLLYWTELQECPIVAPECSESFYHCLTQGFFGKNCQLDCIC